MILVPTSNDNVKITLISPIRVNNFNRMIIKSNYSADMNNDHLFCDT